MMDVIALGCSAYIYILLWRSEILMRETTMDATSKGGVKLRLVERRVSMMKRFYFLHGDGL